MTKPKSETLFHFTKSLKYLKGILKGGLWPRYCLEDLTWLDIDDHAAYPMVCFCDIPLSRIGEHTDFYGDYGIGLSKEWGLRNGLNPAIYCSEKGFVPRVADYLLNDMLFAKFDEGSEEYERHGENFWRLMKLVKPLSGSMFIRGSLVQKDFYQENEWRYTPEMDLDNHVIFQDEFEKKKRAANRRARKFSLKFSPADIKYIFVKNDSDIPEVVDFINDNFDQYPLSDLKVLNSRIVSLRTIEADL